MKAGGPNFVRISYSDGYPNDHVFECFCGQWLKMPADQKVFTVECGRCGKAYHIDTNEKPPTIECI